MFFFFQSYAASLFTSWTHGTIDVIGQLVSTCRIFTSNGRAMIICGRQKLLSDYWLSTCLHLQLAKTQMTGLTCEKYFFLFVSFCFLRKGFSMLQIPGYPGLTLQTRQTSNSERSTYHCFLNVRVKGMCTSLCPTEKNFFFLIKPFELGRATSNQDL